MCYKLCVITREKLKYCVCDFMNFTIEQYTKFLLNIKFMHQYYRPLINSDK